MTINDIQKQIITTAAPHVLVPSAAASGKSETLVNRIKYLLSQGIDPYKIVAITFTNNAASVMYERIGRPEGLFIGTVHSYCNYLLRSGSIDTSKILDNEQFDDLFPLIQENPQCIKEVDYLLVDEAQDSTKEQFEFFELIKPKNYMYFYDLRQSIYGFAGAYPEYLLKKEEELNVTVYEMNRNYRNFPTILKFAKKFLWRLGYKYEDNSIPMRQPDFTSPVIQIEVLPSQLVDLIKRYEPNQQWKDWFILCRTNADVTIFQAILNKAEIPNDTFKQADLTNSQIQRKLKENTIKVLTVHSSKGLENRKVAVYNLLAYNDEEARLCYVAATRAMDQLIWAKTPSKKRRKKVENWE